MKRILLALVMVVLLVATVVAQQPPIEQYDTIGNVYTVTALDTLHSTFSKASGVATAKWYGPRTIQIPKLFDIGDPSSRNGDWATSKAMPLGYFLYANEPFTMKALFVNGDSTGVAQVLVDTLTVTAGVGSGGLGFKAQFPCVYHLKAPVSQLRVTPAASDSVMVVPMYKIGG